MKLYEKKDHLINKNPNLTDKQKSEIIKTLNRYPNLEKNIDWIKSNTLTYEDFKLLILDKAGKSNSQAKRNGIAGLVEGEDYDILYSKDGESLYAVYTHLASKTLASNRVEPKIWTESKVMNWDEEDEFSGRKVYKNEYGELVELKPGAKWCISMNVPDYWDDYTSQGIGFYFWFREANFLKDYKKKIAISVDINLGDIIEFTYGDDDSDEDYPLPERYRNLILKNLNVIKERRKKELRKKLILNPETNKYDYNGDITSRFLKTLDLFEKDNFGNITGFSINFGKVSGNFDCSNNQLTSLEGAPTKVGGDFSCSYNKLTSLKGAPQYVDGRFSCSNNKLTSLKGSPIEVGGSFNCSENQLTSLEGAPKEVGREFNCSFNQLTSLEGAPKKVSGNFNCSYNKLTSLEGAPEKVGGDFKCFDNQLTSLKGSPEEVGGWFDCSYNQLTSLKGAPIKVGESFNCSNNNLISLEGAPQYVGGWFECIENPDLHSLEGIGEVKGHINKNF